VELIPFLSNDFEKLEIDALFSDLIDIEIMTKKLQENDMDISFGRV